MTNWKRIDEDGEVGYPVLTDDDLRRLPNDMVSRYQIARRMERERGEEYRVALATIEAMEEAATDDAQASALDVAGRAIRVRIEQMENEYVAARDACLHELGRLNLGL